MPEPKSITGGIIAAAVSPRREREHSIDLAASLELLDFLYEGRVDGIALLGSTGEFVHFMLEDRARMLDFAVKRSRSPILVNVSHSTLDGAIYLAEEAGDAGVAAVLLMPPYFFRYAQEELVAFCLRFAERVAKETPVYLYNVRQFTNELSLDSVSTLLGSGLFAGIQEYADDWTYVQRLCQSRAAANPGGLTCQVFTGDDRLYRRARSAGVDGAVSPLACAVPELMVKLDRALVAGDLERSGRLDGLVGEFMDRIQRFPMPVGVKEAVKHRGVHIGAHSIPMGRDTERELEAFGEWFVQWLPGVLKA